MKKLTLLVAPLLIFAYSGCSFKRDITETTKFPKQALSVEVVEHDNYETNIDELKTKPEWSPSLERKINKFNSYVDSSFKSVDNHKEYLRKIYNVNYYEFDNQGFNPSQNIANINNGNNNNNNSNSNSNSNMNNGNSNTNNTVYGMNFKRTKIDSSIVQRAKKQLDKKNINTSKHGTVAKQKNKDGSMIGFGNQLLNEYNF
ncbi:hypothetical protein [Poseidonibacter ostreae]|uniref:Uncharacterized protein n=1 Tax=Poseidonibacter ostreae TaxID=2654171 RepID=A0A6L4WWS3_9BACT|nr:hypothetical protein [Poseidonibacter ostreae]KAB7891295.1 hypothetical protein GBG19_00230 [Poseidonibacter ostreae]